MVRRRVSSDGLRLFNMALVHPPSRSKIKQLLFCLFHTEYDDRLEEMVEQCRTATKQLLAYTHHKDINVNQLINNSMFNLIHSTIMEDGVILRKQAIRRNMSYFFDVIEKCSKQNDHHHAIVILAAMSHHALGQFRFKKRKKDIQMLKDFEEKYGTFRDCYKNHLKAAMQNTKYEEFLPCLMVLNMHRDRHRAMATIGRCNLVYEPDHIQSKIGMHAMHHYYPGEKLSLFEEPQVTSNTELILLAQSVKK
jgi:hypothetical protein